MNRPHFRRRPRPVDPNPEYSRLDRMDGLPMRVDACDECVALSRAAVAAQEKIDFPLLTIADLPATGRTRYDGQWPDVLAAEGGLALGRALDLADLPADQSGFTAPADWPVWDYGEGYEIEPEERAVVHHGSVTGCALCADLPDLLMVRAAAIAYDLGLPVPLRSDPPIYRACLSQHGAGVAS